MNNKNYEAIIDVYDCSSEDFWLSDKRVSINDGFYRFSFKLGGIADAMSFVKINFS